MKQKTPQPQRRIAFTVIELLVMIVTVTMLFVLLFSSVPRARKEARLKHCVNNLKQVGLAFRIFSEEPRFPMQIPNSRGGSMESILTGEAFYTFQIMSNELSNNPKIIICPSDDRTAAVKFTLANTNISYFVGVDATDIEPNLFLSGDRNLTNGPLTSTRLLTLNTNSTPGWTEAMHNLTGNVGLADGSVQTFTTHQVQSAMQFAPNRLAFP